MNKSGDEMFKSWDALRETLFREGWVEPEASLTEGDGHALVGERIYAMGYGAGKVKEFIHARVGPSKHVVELEDGPRIETITLRRKNNDKTPFLVRSHLTTTYRRRRDNLTHREPWSKGAPDLSRQLSADEANSMWESFDESSKAGEQQRINMTASMDAKGKLMTRANVLDVVPGDQPSLQLASAGSSTDDGEDDSGTPGGSPASGGSSGGVRRLGGGSGPPAGGALRDSMAVRSPRVRLVDTRARPTSMARSAPEVRTGKPNPTRAVVASDKHRCKLTRKDWDMLPGMGLYCDSCERLCRAYGEWFSWNCPGCDFDMCNKCLEESRNAWAVVPQAGDGQEEPPSTMGAKRIDLTGDWTISMSGRAFAAAAHYVLGMEHDQETGMVVGAHELYGDMHGELQGNTLKLTVGSAELVGAEPEPEPDSDDEDERAAAIQCHAQLLPTADTSGWVIAGTWLNLPRPRGATAAEASSKAAFIGHMTEAKVPELSPRQFASESSESSESSEEESSDEDDDDESPTTVGAGA